MSERHAKVTDRKMRVNKATVSMAIVTGVNLAFAIERTASGGDPVGYFNATFLAAVLLWITAREEVPSST